MTANNHPDYVNMKQSDFVSIMDGQLQILKFLDKIDRKQDQMATALGTFEVRIHDMEEILYQSNFGELKNSQNELMNAVKKISTEVNGLGSRSSWIKEVATNAAAHTLNTARKIHGAASVLDPIKDFKNAGYRDWSIKPIYGQGVHFYPGMQPHMVYPNQPYSNGFPMAPNQVYSQNVNRTPVYGSMTPVYGNRTPAYDPYANSSGQARNVGNRPPAHLNQGYPTPVYDGHQTPAYNSAIRYPKNQVTPHRSVYHHEAGRNHDNNADRRAERTARHNDTEVQDTSSVYEPESPVFN